MKHATLILVVVLSMLLWSMLAAAEQAQYGDWRYLSTTPKPDPMTDEVKPSKFTIRVLDEERRGSLIIQCIQGLEPLVIIEFHARSYDMYTKTIKYRVDKGDVILLNGHFDDAAYFAPAGFWVDQTENQALLTRLKEGRVVYFQKGKNESNREYSLKGSSAAISRLLKDCGA